MRLLYKDTVVEGSSIEDMHHELLRTSFFLPPDVIVAVRERGWKIHNIIVMPNDEWRASWRYMIGIKANIVLQPDSRAIMNAARYVGVSMREHEVTEVKFVVAKQWMHEEAAQ